QRRRPDQEEQAVLLRHLPGLPRTQFAERSSAVRPDAGAAEWRFFFHHQQSPDRPTFRAAAPEQSDTGQPVESGSAVFPEPDPTAQWPRWTAHVSRRAYRTKRKSVHDQGGLCPRQAADQWALLFH